MTFFRMIWDQAVNHGNFSFFILLVGIVTIVIMLRKGRKL